MNKPHITNPTSLGLDAETLQHDFVAKLFGAMAKFPEVATTNDCYTALALVVRDRILDRWVKSAAKYLGSESRTVAYLSAEYLLGPQLANNLLALGITDAAREAMAALDLDLDALIEQEEEPGLGNGGLGRLAACFMDSLATLEIPAIGYGIRYEFGIFEQAIVDGGQVERADKWLRFGNPWEIPRFEIGYAVGLGGHTVQEVDEDGRFRVRWVPDRVVKGIPYDTPILGYHTNNANFLRLWQATADDEFDFQAFDQGDYFGAVDERIVSENITKVLYPNDASMAGRQLRLEQQYFFVSCSLQDMIRLYQQRRLSLEHLHEKYAVQLNDTHPALAVCELMRLLVDVHELSWDAAWNVTTHACGYTNHTLLAEALETWPVALFGAVLPRHLEIVLEINRRFLEQVRAQFPGDDDRARRMSIIDEDHGRRVRMAHLATVGSHAVNGVAALHTDLLKATVLRDFHEVWPERFHNVTNGVTPRRFMALANPRLSRLVTESIGEGWLKDTERLVELEKFGDDAGFRQAWREVKQANKADLASWLDAQHGFHVDPAAMLDVQVKRIHEYKRQHLALLHLMAQLRRVQDGQTVVPRTLLLGGKAAPGYAMAKLIIRLAHHVAAAIDAEPRARGLLKVVFLPDFSVKLGQRVYPSADLSEQISTAGKEASGTGNMKFALNGALTIGTLDGANVEIREAVGAHHFFLFGLDAAEVARWKQDGWSPREVVARDRELTAILAAVADFGDDMTPLVQTLLHTDPFLVTADFRSYLDAQRRVEDRWADPDAWTRSSIRNVARNGRFSSDRSIRDYSRLIWKVKPVHVAKP